MKKKRKTPIHREYFEILSILKDMIDNSLTVGEVCKKYDIASAATVYNWMRKLEKDLIKFNYIEEKIPENSMAAIGNRLKETRNQLKLTQHLMSKMLKVSQPTLNAYEIGRVVLNSNFLDLLYKKFYVNPNYIILGLEPIFMFNNFEDLKKLNNLIDENTEQIKKK